MKSILAGSLASSTPYRCRSAMQKAATRGFTLIESLTALTILAVALFALLQGYSRSLTGVRETGHYASASILAQSLLARAHARKEPDGYTRRGRSGQFYWSVSVQPTSAKMTTRSDRQVALAKVLVRVSWSKTRDLKLETLILAEET